MARTPMKAPAGAVPIELDRVVVNLRTKHDRDPLRRELLRIQTQLAATDTTGDDDEG